MVRMKYEELRTVTQSEKKNISVTWGKCLQRSSVVTRKGQVPVLSWPRGRAKTTSLVCMVHELRYCSRDSLMQSLKLKKKPRTFNSMAKIRSSYHTDGISNLRNKYAFCVVVYELWKRNKTK